MKIANLAFIALGVFYFFYGINAFQDSSENKKIRKNCGVSLIICGLILITTNTISLFAN